ncbi:MAG: chaperone NapD [Vicinamibacterales bacterium]
MTGTSTVRSYLVHVAPDCKAAVAATVAAWGCDVYPADNRDVVVVVVDQTDDGAPLEFDDRLSTVDGVLAVAFVAGHSESES